MDRYDQHRNGRKLEHRQHARDQIDAGGYHRGGVYERADGRGTFHRVGQPHMERKLRGFAHRAHEQQQSGRGERALSDCAGLRHCDDVGYVECAGGAVQQDDAYQQAHIADARGDERFLGGFGGRAAFPPEADEQV